MSFNGIPAGFTWPRNNFRYYHGPKGVGCWTTKPDGEGWFWSFYLKPAGPGARKGIPTEWTYVPRLTTKRRKRKACEERSFNLAYGKKATDGIERKSINPNPPGTGFCMQEKKHVVVQNWEEVEAKNGRTMLRGTCPDCDCPIQKYGKLIDCPECGTYAEASANDYICKQCRQEANNDDDADHTSR